MAMFKDPATIKFVAKKFILSTNDPDNPISTIRQIHPNDTGKIEIFLTNGKSYVDEIDTLSDLISITSNKAFLVKIGVSSEITFSFCHDLSEKEMKGNILDAFAKYAEFDPEINPKYYFEPNEMFPRRVIPKSISTNLNGRTRWQSYSSNQEVFLSGTTTFSFYVICPECNIDEIEESLAEIMLGRVRSTLNGNRSVCFSGRNSDKSSNHEVEMEEALSSTEDWLATVGVTLGNKQGLGSVTALEDNLAGGLKEITNLIMKEIKVSAKE